MAFQVSRSSLSFRSFSWLAGLVLIIRDNLAIVHTLGRDQNIMDWYLLGSTATVKIQREGLLVHRISVDKDIRIRLKMTISIHVR